MINSQIDLEQEIKARAQRLGFMLCGFTTPESPADYGIYTTWLENDRHAGMAYLDSPYHRDCRRDPSRLYPGLQSIIVLAYPYPLPSKLELDRPGQGVICGYAGEEDYHQRFPRLLEPIIEFLEEAHPLGPRPRIFTDSAPILERELGARAGLGWIGKNSCLISPTIGSNFLLTEIFTSIPLKPDKSSIPDHCGTCTRCLDACPTGCIQADRTIDSNLCLSYHTIENRGEIPEAVMQKMNNQLFGCDICQVVCPWNRHAVSNVEVWNGILSLLELHELVTMDHETFITRFGSTPLNRAKHKGILRNCLVILANNRYMPAADLIHRLISEEQDQVIQHTARWAIDKLSGSK